MISSNKLKIRAIESPQYEVRRALARVSFIHFCQFVYPGFITAPHHLVVAAKLDDINEGRSLRVHIAEPPRHSKSLMCSELLPCYLFGHHPDKNIIHASYASSLSNGFSLKVRAMIRDNPAYHALFPAITLDPDRRRLDDWRLVTGGGFRSIGVQGGITGHGADYFIIDDPTKEGDELSPTTLENIYIWYASAAMTRLSPGGAVLIPATRWAVNDLPGRLVKLGETDSRADQWEVLSFPALALENDPLGRELGEALWPERYDRERLLAIQAVSERYFGALFQQKPELHDEPLFVQTDFERGRKTSSKYFWTVDLALTDTERSDYTTLGRWSWEKDVLCLHVGYRLRDQWPKVKKKIVSLMNSYPGENWYYPKHLVELFAVQTLRSERRDGYRIKEVSLPGDKYSRASVLSDVAKNATVLVMSGSDGDYFVEEHCGFPDIARHDDWVDNSSVATHALGLQNRFSIAVHGVKTDVRGDRRDFEALQKLGF